MCRDLSLKTKNSLSVAPEVCCTKTYHGCSLAAYHASNTLLNLKDRSTDVVCWLLNVSATCECISWTDLLKQFYMLPH